MRRWALNRSQGVYASPCGRFVAQREARRLWSLWRLSEPGKLPTGKLIGEHFESLKEAQSEARRLINVLADD